MGCLINLLHPFRFTRLFFRMMLGKGPTERQLDRLERMGRLSMLDGRKVWDEEEEDRKQQDAWDEEYEAYDGTMEV